MKSAKIIRLRILLLWGTIMIFTLSKNSYAQTAKVSGTITSQSTSAPVPGASVNVKNTQTAAIADESGNYKSGQ